MKLIVTVGNTKGGVGKTTLALNLAILRAMQGRDVWVIDADRQATAITAITMRAEAGRLPSLACSAYPDGPTLRAQVMQQARKYQDIVIDAGGRDSTALRAALTLADLLIVPFQPRSYDVWALADIARLVDEARAIRDGLRAVAVLNLADPTGADNREASDAAAEYHQFQFIDAPLRRRKAYANAAGMGLSVVEAPSRDDKACAELANLASQLFGLPMTMKSQ